MRAVIYDAWGGPERLRIGEKPIPEPGPGEIRLKVAAAGVNPIDWKIREGMFECIFDHEFPITPGWDGAGTVDAMGDGVTGWAQGDRTYFYCRKSLAHDGTFGEYIVIPADWVARPPDSLSDGEAACVPLCALTAYQTLIEFARIRPGDAVLVHAGAGGVGSFALPMAKLLGAKVYATASAANHDYCRARGADKVIDYTVEDYRDILRELEPDGLSLVFDTIGGAIPGESPALVRSGGALVCLNEAPDMAEAEKRGIRAVRLYSEPNGAQLSEIAGWIDRGSLPMPDIEIMELDDAAKAMNLSQAGHVRGKIALTLE